MHVAVAIRAVFHLATFEFGDGAGHVSGDGSCLGVGHQATWAERTTEFADHRHEVGRGNHDVEVHVAFFDVGGQVIGTHHVCPCIASQLGVIALGEHCYAHGFAGAGRHRNGAANGLFALFGVQTKAHRKIECFVKLGFRHRLHFGDCSSHVVQFVAIQACGRCDILFTAVIFCGHKASLVVMAVG